MTTALERPALRPLRAGDPAIPALAALMAEAYPVMGLDSAEALARLADRIERTAEDPQMHSIVAEEDGALVGAMRLYDFTMNARGRDVEAGGVGAVAVARTHKRRGIARALVRAFLEHYRERRAPFAALHAFRPDFYRRLGFGYGTPLHRFSFAPAALPSRRARATVRALGAADVDAVYASSERVRRTTHGLFAKLIAPLRVALEDPSQRWIGAERDGVLRGFAATAVELGPKQTQNRNALVVRELAAEDDDAQDALFGYLHGQRDAFARIVVESQDPAFFLAAADPRDGSDRIVAPPAAHRVAETGLAVMYRLVDVEAAFATLPPAFPFVLRVELDDPWYAPTAGARTFAFGPDGVRATDAAHDAVLRVGSADAASLLVGSLALGDLLRYRLAAVEPASATAQVARLFAVERPPQCTARF